MRSHRTLGRLSAICVLVVGGLGGCLLTAPVASATAPCSRGDVALTFDDGPRPAATPSILDTLKARGAPATFFAVGSVVDRYPHLAQRILREGHRLENHTYGHENLLSLPSPMVRDTLRRADASIVRTGASRPRLYRPPYGATNARVRQVAAELGLREVMWTLDSKDYRTGSTPAQIVEQVLTGLTPQGVVLLHDGVANSTATASALPRIIDGIRSRGFCIGALSDAGTVLPALPRVDIASTAVLEGARGSVGTARIPLTLSAPTSRTVAVRAVTREGSAVAGGDFQPVDVIVQFPAGSRTATLAIPVVGDDLHELDEQLSVQLLGATAATLGNRTGAVTIRNDDARPALHVDDQVLHEPRYYGAVLDRSRRSPRATLALRLSAPSGLPVQATVRARHVTTDDGDLRLPDAIITIKPGQTEHRLVVHVLPDASREGQEQFDVVLSNVAGATLMRGTAAVMLADGLGQAEAGSSRTAAPA